MKFFASGHTSILHIVRKLLIDEGYYEVHVDTDADFIVMDWDYDAPSPTRLKPTLLLSNDCMYLDRDVSFQRLKKGKMAENAPIVIPSIFEGNLNFILETLHVESVLRYKQDMLVLRVFNVYGPNIHEGVVHNFVAQAKTNVPYTVESSGYQVRTFLYEDDFIDLFRSVFPKFITGNLTGIYNVGGTTEYTVLNVVDAINQLMGIQNAVEKVDVDHYICHWKIPDITRIQAVTQWSPTTSLRKGLWQMLEKK